MYVTRSNVPSCNGDDYGTAIAFDTDGDVFVADSVSSSMVIYSRFCRPCFGCRSAPLDNCDGARSATSRRIFVVAGQ
jgi:hypothetical protein